MADPTVDALLERIADLLNFLDEIEDLGLHDPTPAEIRSFFKAPEKTLSETLEDAK